MTKIKDIQNIETTARVIVMITNIEKKLDKNGNTYTVYELSDGETKVSARHFADSNLETGNIIEANLNSSLYNGNMTFKINSYENLTGMPGIDMADFLVSAPMTDENMNDQIEELVEKIQNKDLQDFVRYFYQKYEKPLVYYPAAKAHHHNYYGGLKYHSLCVAKNAYALATTYDYVNMDLVIAGALLHDIGKLFEYDADVFSGAEYNAEGNLFGHLFMGAEMVKSEGEKRNISSEILRNLIHIILAHHDNPEWGAVKMPSTIEARIVSSADFVDSQVEAMHQVVEATEPGENANSFVCGVKPYRPNI